MLHGELPAFSLEHWSTVDAGTLVKGVLLEWVVGSVFVGLACMAITFFTVLALTSRVGKNPADSMPIEAEAIEPASAIEGQS